MKDKFQNNKHKFCYIRKALADILKDNYRKDVLYYQYRKLNYIVKTFTNSQIEYKLKEMRYFDCNDIMLNGCVNDIGFFFNCFVGLFKVNLNAFDNDVVRKYSLTDNF